MSTVAAPAENSTPAGHSPRRRHWGRWLTALLLLAALIGGVIWADGWARHRAEDQIADQIEAQLGSSQPIDVQIADRPFLIDLLTNQLSRGTIRASDLSVDWQGQTVPISQVLVRLNKISPLRDPSHAVIGTLDGQVLLSYDTLSRITGVQLSSASNGRIKAEQTLAILGAQIPASVVAGVSVNPQGKITLVSPQATLAGVDVPPSIVDAAIRSIQDKLVLPTLPAGLSYAAIIPGSEGATISIVGTQVEIAKLR